MPVLIAARAGETDVVRELAARLVTEGGEVRCHLEEDDHELRMLGCKIAVGMFEDDATLEAALTNVHTFVPILPDPLALEGPEDLAWLEGVAKPVAAAAAAAGVEQTILAVPALGEEEPLGAAFAAVERAFAEACRPLCVLRTGLVWGPERPLTATARALRSAPGLPGAGAAILSVVRVGDLAAAIAAADDREELHGTWELGGHPHALVDLVDAAGDGWPRRPPGPLAAALLARGLAVGSSAEAELGIGTSPV